MNINISADKVNMAKNKLWRGAGMVSGNNSSRLLLDYKAEHPEKYQELLRLIFGSDGIAVNHLKVEMGADINSSSGTEPSVKRKADESADVTRGAGFQLAADAERINPELTLDMLFWSEPKWITDSEDVYDARYNWYKETLIAAYETYGLVFDYVSVNRNERYVDGEWIKYCSRRLKSERECPYDFSRIKIVSADEENSWRIADMMIEDEELRDSVDVIGSHYTSHCTENVRLLSDKYGKDVWFSEGCAPMSYSQGTYRFDGSGLSGINGVLDIADRIVAMYPCGCMTLYEYQPVIAAYYDGVCYCQKQLINACEPWSGFYQIESGFYMALHFSRFFGKGWAFIDDACYCDGEKGGDGHALVNTNYSFMTATDLKTGDYSTVIVNSTDKPVTYDFRVSGLKKSDEIVHIWETRGPDCGNYDENYFRKTQTLTPEENHGVFEYSVEVKPFSMITVSTIDIRRPEYEARKSEILPLPYCDDFQYSDYHEKYLLSRGSAPRFTTDEGGAFEISENDGRKVLMQMITYETKADEWGWTPSPVTNFGDDRWYNYSVSTTVKLCKSDKPGENYAGVGLRYTLGAAGMSGYALLLHESGAWRLMRNDREIMSGMAEDIDTTEWVSMKLSAEDVIIRACINDILVTEYTENRAFIGAGRAALYSSLNNNCFGGVEILPVSETPYTARFDDTDCCFEYSGNWEHILMSSYFNYKRTLSKGMAGAAAVLKFSGRGFMLFGENTGHCTATVKLDGKVIAESMALPVSGKREVFFSVNGLSDTDHTAEITVSEGILALDGAEIIL